MARVPPSPERYVGLQHETRLQAWVAEHGYSTPSVLTLTAPGEVADSPVQVVSRAPGDQMATAMISTPWRLPRLATELGSLQAQLHSLPVPEWADSTEWSILDRRLALVRIVLGRLEHPGLERGLGAVEELAPALQVSDPVLCHGDFHPRNVLVSRESCAVIDWTDAGIGDRHCDIARTAWLFRFAAAAAPSRGERTVVSATAPLLSNRFLAGYRRLRSVDADRLRLWRPVHVLHAWAQFVADSRELFAPSREGEDYRAGIQSWAEAQFDRALRDVG